MSAGWDQAVLGHLDEARRIYEEAGVIQFLQTAVSEVWRDNRARWSPNRHFDDTNTLGYQTSRNVNNRIAATIYESDTDNEVLVEVESGIPVLTIAGLRLRVVKAPIESGNQPDFYTDFDWSSSATRQGAAQRNSANYYPLQTDDWTLTYETDPRPLQKRRVERCRDLFLLWAADLGSDKTSGWLGLPRVGDIPWLGVTELWDDVYAQPAHHDDPDVDPDDDLEDES